MAMLLASPYCETFSFRLPKIDNDRFATKTVLIALGTNNDLRKLIWNINTTLATSEGLFIVVGVGERSLTELITIKVGDFPTISIVPPTLIIMPYARMETPACIISLDGFYSNNLRVI